MELSVIKEEKSTRFSSLLEECGVFFAFSKQQFDEGKTYHEVSVILGDKIWDFFGEKRCFDEGSVKNIFIWYAKQVKNLGTIHVTSEVNKYKELK